MRYLITSPNDPMEDFATHSIVYNTSANPLQIGCTIAEGEICYRSISAQASTWWGKSTISQDSSIHSKQLILLANPTYIIM